MRCVLCGNDKLEMIHKGCRDNPNVNVMKCKQCGLVFLDSFEQITDTLYEDSGMHQDDEFQYEKWIQQTYEDDARRAEWIKEYVCDTKPEKLDICDFGCGNGGFLRLLDEDKRFNCFGVELEDEAREYINKDGISCKHSLDDYGDKKFDIITMWHVVEHLTNPTELLQEIRKFLKEDGILIVETPNADDALLTRYKSDAFADFTYWSLHVVLYNSDTLQKVMEQSGYSVVENTQIQRYPLTNHMYWLSKKKPGGHKVLQEFASKELEEFYVEVLKERKECDTLLLIAGK